MYMNGADVVAEILKREGTEFLACYPRNPLIDACAKIGIRPILSRQERVGVGLADGYSRMRRGKRNGVFAVQQGPGIENAFPGVAQAYSENVPILILPASTAQSRQYVRPTFGAAEVYRPVTKWSARAHSVAELPDLMRRAYHAMRTGKGGPVLVEVPVEVWEAEFEGDLSYAPVAPYRAAPDPAAVKEAARLLLGAANPILWAGQGVLYAEASDLLAALAELVPAPVMTTNPGKSAIAENHPLALGASTRSQPKMLVEFLKNADLVFAIGSSLTRTPFGPNVPAGKRIVHSTNDAEDVHKDYRADHAVIGDARLVLEALIEEVKRQKGRRENALRALSESVAAVKKTWLAEWSAQLDSNEVPINQYRVIRDLMRNVDRDNVILTHDSGSPREQLLPFWETTAPGSYMGWGKSTQLGYGLGLIMGAKLAAPEKLCINIMGDSAIGMTGMDLETAARNRIAILTIVFNNGVMAAERDVMVAATEKYGALTVGGNYAKVADGLGVAAIRVERPDAFAPALREAIKTTESGAPFLIECVVKQGYEFSRYPLAGL
jgi:acetolactate synthase-1/2/3 large subunit